MLKLPLSGIKWVGMYHVPKRRVDFLFSNNNSTTLSRDGFMYSRIIVFYDGWLWSNRSTPNLEDQPQRSVRTLVGLLQCMYMYWAMGTPLFQRQKRALYKCINKWTDLAEYHNTVFTTSAISWKTISFTYTTLHGEWK